MRTINVALKMKDLDTFSNVLCSSMDGRGSAAVRNCSHISETQHSKNLVLAHATSPEEAGREFCSF